MFDSEVTHEFELASKSIGLTEEQLDRCTQDAIDAAFIGEVEKGWLRELVARFE